MPIVKDQKWPAIYITLQNYSENVQSAARTEDLPEMPSLIVFSASLLLDENSLFRKIFSLIRHLEFPVNSEAQRGQTMRIPSNHRGFHVYG